MGRVDRMFTPDPTTELHDLARPHEYDVPGTLLLRPKNVDAQARPCYEDKKHVVILPLLMKGNSR